LISRSRLSNSITARLFAATAAILSLGGGLALMGAELYGHRAAERAFDKLLAGAAFEVARSISIVGGRPSVDLPVSAFELLALSTDDRVMYAVTDPDGQLLTGARPLSLQAPPGRLVFVDAVDHGEKARYAVLSRAFSERSFSGSVNVYVGHTTIGREALQSEIVSNALILLLGVCVVMIVLALIAVRASLSPLRKIEAILRARDPKDLTPIDVRVPVEIEANVAALNRFMSRLSRRMTAMQRLIADASHQLQTPIAALVVHTRAALTTEDPAALRSIAQVANERALGLGRLASQLLSQAMVIHRTDSVSMEFVDLRDVAVRAEEETDFVALGGLYDTWLVLPEDPVWVLGEKLSLTEGVKNLLNNALKYGVAPYKLIVEADDARKSALVAVADCGPGIREELWSDLAVRFARTAGSSSSPRRMAAASRLSGRSWADFASAYRFPSRRGRRSHDAATPLCACRDARRRACRRAGRRHRGRRCGESPAVACPRLDGRRVLSSALRGLRRVAARCQRPVRGVVDQGALRPRQGRLRRGPRRRRPLDQLRHRPAGVAGERSLRAAAPVAADGRDAGLGEVAERGVRPDIRAGGAGLQPRSAPP